MIRKFRVCYSDNSGPKIENFEGQEFIIDDSWFIILGEFVTAGGASRRIKFAIPIDLIYSVEEIE